MDPGWRVGPCGGVGPWGVVAYSMALCIIFFLIWVTGGLDEDVIPDPATKTGPPRCSYIVTSSAASLKTNRRVRAASAAVPLGERRRRRRAHDFWVPRQVLTDGGGAVDEVGVV